jgi:hypothetical protein
MPQGVYAVHILSFAAIAFYALPSFPLLHRIVILSIRAANTIFQHFISGIYLPEALSATHQ